MMLLSLVPAGRLPTGGDTARMRREAAALLPATTLVQSKAACPDDLKGALFNHIPK